MGLMGRIVVHYALLNAFRFRWRIFWYSYLGFVIPIVSKARLHYCVQIEQNRRIQGHYPMSRRSLRRFHPSRSCMVCSIRRSVSWRPLRRRPGTNRRLWKVPDGATKSERHSQHRPDDVQLRAYIPGVHTLVCASTAFRVRSACYCPVGLPSSPAGCIHAWLLTHVDLST